MSFRILLANVIYNLWVTNCTFSIRVGNEQNYAIDFKGPARFRVSIGDSPKKREPEMLNKSNPDVEAGPKTSTSTKPAL